MGSPTSSLQEQLQTLVRPVLVSLGWGTCFAGITLWGIFQGFLLPFTPFLGADPPGNQNITWWLPFYYTVLVIISVIPPLVIRDVGRSIGAYILSYFLGAIITYQVLALPNIGQAQQILIQGAVNWTFTAIFPGPLFIGLLATVVGAGVEEHFDLGKED